MKFKVKRYAMYTTDNFMEGFKTEAAILRIVTMVSEEGAT